MNAPTLADKLKAVYPGLQSDEYKLAASGIDIESWTPRQTSLKRPSLAAVDSAYQALTLRRQAEAASISSFEFFARIPDATKAKISAASVPGQPFSVQLQWGLPQISAAQTVYSNNPQLNTLLSALVAAGILTASEKAQILDF